MRVFLLFITFLLSSCLTQVSQVPESETPEMKKLPPVKVEVSQVFSVQDSLFVKVSIEALKDLYSDDIEISALGLEEGKVITEQRIRLSKFIDKKEFNKGAKYLIPFELPRKKIAEFQLKCSWGDDVRKNLESEKREQKTDDLEEPEPLKPNLIPVSKQGEQDSLVERKILSSKLLIDSIDVLEESCEKIECNLKPGISSSKARKVTIRAQVKNLTNKPVKDIVLAFGLFWFPKNKIPDLPKDLAVKKQGEEELVFRDLVLPPGGSTSFNVKLDRILIELPQGEFRPHVRVLSFN